MDIKYKTLELNLEFTFAISRGSKNTCRTVIVELEKTIGGKTYNGIGEAVFSEFYGESEKSVVELYETLISNKILDDLDPFNVQDFETRMSKFTGKHQAAKAGLDMALYDLRCKALNIPLYKYLGLDPTKTPKTSYTIGIADIETIKHKTLTALERDYNILKVKLGGQEDLTILETVRSLAPNAIIRVDANAAWQCKDALKILSKVENFGIEFVEEPLRLDSSPLDYEKLYNETPLPLMADESCHTSKDVPKCAKYFHAVNIKHTKTGGLTEAIRLIHTARAHNLKIMLGCFTETSVAITAFAHLSPLVDYADLDGSLLLAKDPYRGVKFDGNKIVLPSRAGLGVGTRL